MGLKKNVGGRDRLVRALLAVVLTIVAVRSLRNGKRRTGLLAGVGALGVGFTATSRYRGTNDTASGDATADRTTDAATATGTADESRDEPKADAPGRRSRPSGSLVCASCGEPIRVGQGRGPNDEDEIVHESCA
jgi:threonine dehydrogenase-like Zn-dependent dehydrogenase